MNVAELKTDIIQSVIETDNPTLLEKVAAYIKSLLAEDDWWDKLSENERSFIHKSARQVDEGKIVSNAVVRVEINRLLKKS